MENIGIEQTSAPVTNDLLAIWEENIQSIKEIAFSNTKNSDSYSISDLIGVIRRLNEKVPNKADRTDGITELETLVERENIDFRPLYVLSNQSKLFGAVAIYDSDLLTKISGIFKRDYYVIPSSIHEVLLLPKTKNLDPEEIRQTVQEINKTVVDPQEVLSDNIYLFSRETNSLFIVENKT